MARLVKNLNILLTDKGARVLREIAAEERRSSTAQGELIMAWALEELDRRRKEEKK